jgi:hypothetical protein
MKRIKWLKLKKEAELLEEKICGNKKKKRINEGRKNNAIQEWMRAKLKMETSEKAKVSGSGGMGSNG